MSLLSQTKRPLSHERGRFWISNYLVGTGVVLSGVRVLLLVVPPLMVPLLMVPPLMVPLLMVPFMPVPIVMVPMAMLLIMAVGLLMSMGCPIMVGVTPGGMGGIIGRIWMPGAPT